MSCGSVSIYIRYASSSGGGDLGGGERCGRGMGL